MDSKDLVNGIDKGEAITYFVSRDEFNKMKIGDKVKFEVLRSRKYMIKRLFKLRRMLDAPMEVTPIIKNKNLWKFPYSIHMLKNILKYTLMQYTVLGGYIYHLMARYMKLMKTGK